MAYINITLRSPVDVEIIGVLLANGKTANASLHYDPTTGLQDFVIDHSGEIKLGKSCKTLRNVWYMSACNGILTGHEAKQP